LKFLLGGIVRVRFIEESGTVERIVLVELVGESSVDVDMFSGLLLLGIEIGLGFRIGYI
jgi:hypothetical protein